MSRALLLMVPGAYFSPQDFADHGFPAALERHAPQVDALVADLPAERYLDGDVAPFLYSEIVVPVLGDRRLWLLGISLGAMGALLYAQAHPETVEGIILLAPFLGTRGLVAEAVAAGGLASWEPEPIPTRDIERRLLAGLKAGLPPRLHLGYGATDRYATASQLLADRMQPDRVVVIEGGHDWPTWEKLWHAILGRAPFDDPAR